MRNFTFHSPTKVLFGKATEETVGAEIKQWQGSRVLVHYGSQSAVKSGLISRIEASLKAEGLFFVELGGVVPNPRLGTVHEGIALCREHKIDFILAVGGGSVIDSSKAIAMGVPDDGEVWDFFAGLRKPQSALPVGVVLTIAAAGSETSQSCVITNEDGWLKRGSTTHLNRPKFAIMNPELTTTLPPYQTACGIVDIMMHTLDRYFAPETDVDFTDRISEALLQSVIRSGADCMKNAADYEARANLMWAGSISHNTLTGCGKTDDFACHQIEHELSGKYDVAHGAGLAAVWGHWARNVCDANVMKFAQYANRVWNISVDFENPAKTALAGIEATENFFRSIGMPTNLRELEVAPTQQDIEEMAEKATFFGKRSLGSFKKLEKADVIAIYGAANR